MLNRHGCIEKTRMVDVGADHRAMRVVRGPRSLFVCVARVCRRMGSRKQENEGSKQGAVWRSPRKEKMSDHLMYAWLHSCLQKAWRIKTRQEGQDNNRVSKQKKSSDKETSRLSQRTGRETKDVDSQALHPTPCAWGPQTRLKLINAEMSTRARRLFGDDWFASS